VDTPYGFWDKLSSVNARASSEAVVDIVRDLSGLPVEGYVVTGFDGFTRLVNDFGGVVVDVPFAMADPKSQAFLSAGEQLLWGPTPWPSPATARSGERLHPLLPPGAGHARRPGPGPGGRNHGAARLARAPLRVHLDRPLAGDLLTLAAGAFEIDPAQVGNRVLPGTIQMIAGASVVVLDPEAEEIYRDLDDGILTPEE